MALFKNRFSEDVITVFGPVADHYRELEPGWEEVVTHEEAEYVSAELKGEELDEKLKEVGLSTAGRADEKRRRYADHITNETTATAEEI